MSLTMDTDQSVYSVGESIVVTLTGDTAGGAATFGVFVDVGYDDALVNEPAMASQTTITSFGGGAPWTATNPLCGASDCLVFNQLTGGMPLVPDPDIEKGTLVLTAASPGVLTLTAGVDRPVDWFGAPAPPDVTVTIIPEPGTLGLLGLGMLALAWSASRRATSAARSG